MMPSIRDESPDSSLGEKERTTNYKTTSDEPVIEIFPNVSCTTIATQVLFELPPVRTTENDIQPGKRKSDNTVLNATDTIGLVPIEPDDSVTKDPLINKPDRILVENFFSSNKASLTIRNQRPALSLYKPTITTQQSATRVIKINLMTTRKNI